MAAPDFFIWTTSAELGEAVLVARQAAGLSQAELAQRARVSRKFLSELEHGKQSLRADKVMQVLDALALVPLIVPAALTASLR
jgi:transcriptional regulator with XRE-family HTH domain